MGIGGALSESPAARVRARGRLPSWSGWAWGAIAIVAAFVALTCWWLARDRGVPVFDAGTHLYSTIAHYDLLRAGDVGGFLSLSGFYPPTTFVVGALAMLPTGPSRWSPVVAQNLIYVPLLAAGCYGTGRLVGGPRAGCLAVAFALGCPLVIEQFHVFMIDAPVAALVAMSVWLILESRRFERVGVAAAAGLVVGIGLESKEQFPLFVAGLLAVVLLRGGGWRNWRGIAAFAGVAFVVGAPWYLANLEELGRYASAGLASDSLPPRGKPALLSVANLWWYFWANLNALLFAPLFAFAAVGAASAARDGLRARRGTSSTPALGGWAPELFAGLCVGWLTLTLTPHHDLRYAMPLVVYLATIGTAWIVPLRPRPRRLATAALAVAVLATTLGATFGAGGEVRVFLPGGPVATKRIWGVPPPSQITLYADRNYLVAGPRRASDVGGLLETLRGEGVTGVFWTNAFLGDPVFDTQGLAVLARIAELEIVLTPEWDTANPRHALLVREPLGSRAPCVDLGDGTGVTVLVGDPATPGGRPWCPGT